MTTPRLPMPPRSADLALMVPRGAVHVLIRLLALNGANVAEAAVTARTWADRAADPRYALLAGILEEASAPAPPAPSPSPRRSHA